MNGKNITVIAVVTVISIAFAESEWLELVSEYQKLFRIFTH